METKCLWHLRYSQCTYSHLSHSKQSFNLVDEELEKTGNDEIVQYANKNYLRCCRHDCDPTIKL